ncbi:hypothetical protein NC652_040294 [Populus alba x Populus x berolinensis]|nr:hypothetical protein NC652_040294 [Populus alba x Populus x berolinensis]
MKKSLMLLLLSKFLKTCLKIISHQGIFIITKKHTQR